MICKNCSTEFEGVICPECGTTTEEIENIAESVDEVSVPETDCGEPTIGDSDVIDVPKKKRTGLIVAIIIIVLVVAAFCIAAFTDLIFPKQAQFISILSNMGSDVSTDFDGFTDESLEMKLSAKLNGESENVTKLFSEEEIDFVNSLSLSGKYTQSGEDRTDLILSLFENNEKIIDILGFETKDVMYLKTDFSDIVVKKQFDGDVDMTEYAEFVKNELKAVLEKHEPVEGVYDGEFDLGVEVKTLTVTLGESEIDETLDKIISEGYKVFSMTETYEKPEDGYGIKEIYVSSLYTGAFSFARKSLGVSVIIKEEDGTENEIIFYSNKENKAIYGHFLKVDYYYDGDYYGYRTKTILTDNYEIKNGEQTGKITIADSVVYGKDTSDDEITYSNNIITYSISKNKFNCNYVISDEDRTAEFKISAVRDDKGFNASVALIADSVEYGAIYFDVVPCESVSVQFDTDKAVDVMEGDLTDVEEKLIADLKNLIKENEDSVFLGMISELFAEEEKTDTEIFLNDLGVDHVSAPMKGTERGAFLTVQFDDDVMLYNLHEVGYENNVVKEIIETNYVYLPDYTEPQKQSFNDAMIEGLKDVDDLNCAEVTGEIVGDYVVTKVHFKDIDVPENFSEVVSSGAILTESPTDTAIYFDYVATSFESVGYLRIE